MKGVTCFFNTTQSWGGGEKWHYETALHLHLEGFPIILFVAENSELHKKAIASQLPAEIVDISKFSYLSRKKVRSIASLYKKNNVHTVILNSSDNMKIGGQAAKKANLSRVIYRRGSAIPIKNSVVNRYFFRNVLTEVLANSEATKATINANNKDLFPKDKITVIPNAVDITAFDRLAGEPLYEREASEFIIGNLGRLVYQKNQDFLLDVALELKERGISFKMLIGGEGKLRKDLENKITSSRLQNNVVLLGFIDNPRRFMESIDVFLLSSHWEGFGYVLTEAMLAKKPCIAFDHSSNGQIVTDTRNGYLVPTNDVTSFCDRIETLSKDSDLIQKMGVVGRESVEQKFESSIIRQKVKDYLFS